MSEGEELRGPSMRSWSSGRDSGYLEGMGAALEALASGRQAHEVILDAVRMFGRDAVIREVARVRPRLAELVEVAIATFAERDTQPIELPRSPELSPNSPLEVGAQGEPGGWTGGLTHPTSTPETARRRRERREG